MNPVYFEKEVYAKKNAIKMAKITLFYRPTCSVCPRAVKVLDSLDEFYPHLHILKRVVDVPYLSKVENFTTDFYASHSLRQFGEPEVPTILVENEQGEIVGKITGADWPPIELELWLREKLANVMNLVVRGDVRLDYLPPLAVSNFKRIQELTKLKSERVLKKLILQALVAEKANKEKCIPLKMLSKKSLLPLNLVDRLMGEMFKKNWVYIDTNTDYCHITEKGGAIINLLG